MKYLVTLTYGDGREETVEVSFSSVRTLRKQFDIDVNRAILAHIAIERSKVKSVTIAEYYGNLPKFDLMRELGINGYGYVLPMMPPMTGRIKNEPVHNEYRSQAKGSFADYLRSLPSSDVTQGAQETDSEDN